MQASRTKLTAFLLLALLSSAAFAGKPSDAKRAEARARFESGTKYYNIRSYEKALEEFQAVYLLSGQPSLLFNIGQCERQLSRHDDARKSFQAYLREAQPDEKQAAEVRELIANLEKSIKAQEAARLSPPNINEASSATNPLVKSPEQTVVEAPSATSNVEVAIAAAPPARAKRNWVWGVIAGGAVAVVALGVGLGVGLTRGNHYPLPTDGKINGN